MPTHTVQITTAAPNTSYPFSYLHFRRTLSRERPVLEIVRPNEVEREKVRGVFAVGTIAALYYIRQVISPAPGVPILLAQTPRALLQLNFPVISITSDSLMYAFAVYVVAVAVALADQMVCADRRYSKPFAAIFALAYFVAQLSYMLAVAALAVTVIFLFYPVIAFFVLLFALQLLLSKQSRRDFRNRATGFLKKSNAPDTTIGEKS